MVLKYQGQVLDLSLLSVAFLPTVISHLTSVSQVYGNKESDLTKRQLSKICIKRVVVNLLCLMLNLVCLEIENSKLSIKSPTSLDLQDLQYCPR